MVSNTLFYQKIIEWVGYYIVNPDNPTEPITTIQAQGNGPRPSSSLYCVLDLTNKRTKGHASKSVTDTVTNTISYDYLGIAILSIDFIGEGANEAAETLRSTVEHEYVRSLFDSIDVSPYSIGDILDITSLKDSRYEERARFELGLNVIFSSSEVVNWIEKVTINGTTVSITD